jgi:hypothetical protein
MGCYRYTAHQPYLARRRTTSRRCSPRSYSGRAWYTGSACSGHYLRRPGDFSTIETCTDGASCCFGCRGQWRGVDLGCGVCIMLRLGVPLSMYVYRFGVELGEVLKWRPPPGIASRDGRRIVGPPRWLRRLAHRGCRGGPRTHARTRPVRPAVPCTPGAS